MARGKCRGEPPACAGTGLRRGRDRPAADRVDLSEAKNKRQKLEETIPLLFAPFPGFSFGRGNGVSHRVTEAYLRRHRPRSALGDIEAV